MPYNTYCCSFKKLCQFLKNSVTFTPQTLSVLKNSVSLHTPNSVSFTQNSFPI